MPTDFQHIVIYLIVLGALAMVVRFSLAARKRKPGCGQNCGCEGVKRDPSIQRFIDRRGEGEG